jgi:ABC-type sugar transport system ATPase subunit
MIGVENLSIRVAAFALNDISFAIAAGEYGILMGRTGSGKTTILETICGLRPAAAGSIKLLGEDVTHLKPAERGIGYVPQDKTLFMTMSIRENLAFALRIRKWSGDAIAQRVKELAELLGLDSLLDRHPHGLSGGESQRVSLGRALASRPGILCLDEPLSALDDETREEMHDLLRSVRERTGVTTLHVTHHLSDAQKLADKIFLLKDGAVRRISMDEARGPVKSLNR